MPGTGHESSEPIRYPTNHVIGVVDGAEQAQRVVEALTGGGFLESEVHLGSGVQRADDLHATTGRTGFANMMVRLAERLGVEDEEMEFKSLYERAMRDGHVVVLVAAPTAERKALATRMLREHGARSITFHGKYTIESIQPPNSP